MPDQKTNSSTLAESLMVHDFCKLYDVNMKATEERLQIMKMALTFCSAPFFVLTALLTTKVIAPENVLSISKLPSFIFAFILICGLANIIPLIRFIEVTGTHMRTARAINNFRRFYTISLKEPFKQKQWNQNLPVDPKYPPTFSIVSWAGINVAFFVIVNAIYITLGIFGFDNNNPLSLGGAAVFLVTAVLQYSLYPLKGRSKHKSSPLPVDGIPQPEVEI